MKIDDLKINSYVDGELNEQELKEFEAIMNNEPEIRQKVEDLRKINHEAKAFYAEIINDDIPPSIKDLLVEKESIWKKFSKLKLELFRPLVLSWPLLWDQYLLSTLCNWPQLRTIDLSLC